MIIVSVSDLSFGRGIDTLFSHVSFALQENDRAGLVGVNGCGKTTLLRLLIGEWEPTEGAVHLSGEKTVGILRQDAALSFGPEADGRTVLDVTLTSTYRELLETEARLAELEKNGPMEAYLALHEKFIADGGMEFRGRCISTLKKMGFAEEDLGRPFSSLSGGQRTRLALSCELCREPDLLLLDEPTNHLDAETLGWLESYLCGYKKAVLAVSHDRYFLDRVTNKTLWMENGKVTLYGGGYTESLEKRKTDKEIAEHHYENQQKEIAHQEAYIERLKRWNREKSIIAAESRQKRLDKMEKLERPEDAPTGPSMKFSSCLPSGNDVLIAENLRFGYPGGDPLFEKLTFTVKRGDRFFVAGANGCGKSTLLKVFLGALLPTGGRCAWGTGVKVGYYDQENQRLTPQNTVLEELHSAYPHRTETDLRTVLAHFRFFGDDVFKTVSVLSGGERARLTLARLMLSEVNVLVLDEPTNHLDIPSREALEEAVSGFEGTLVCVSHDRYLVSRLATKILDLGEGGGRLLTVTRPGEAYDELLAERERLKRENVAEEAPTEVLSGKDQYLAAKAAAADERKKKARREKLTKEAETLEARLDELRSLCEKSMTDYVALTAYEEEKEQAEARLLEIYEEIL